MKLDRVARVGLLVAGAALAAVASGAESAGPVDSLPMTAELAPFVERGSTAIYVGRADLNRDGRDDWVLVLEKQKAKPSDPDIDQGQRPLLILLRQADGSLKVAKRNDKVVYCSTCGGMMGDPFVSVELKPGLLTVNHYGGSGWRWSASFSFGWSRRDQTWQLVLVEESSFHAGDPDKTMKNRAFKPPRDFGKIDLADFDPQHYRKQGAK